MTSKYVLNIANYSFLTIVGMQHLHVRIAIDLYVYVVRTTGSFSIVTIVTAHSYLSYRLFLGPIDINPGFHRYIFLSVPASCHLTSVPPLRLMNPPSHTKIV